MADEVKEVVEDGKGAATSAAVEAGATEGKPAEVVEAGAEGAENKEEVVEDVKEPEKKFTDEDMKKAREGYQAETRKEREARIRAEERARVLEELREGKQSASQAASTEVVEPQKPKRPIENDFENREEFDKAMDKYEEESYNYRRHNERKADEETQAKTQRQTVLGNHIKLGKEKYPDFDEKVVNGTVKVTGVMMDAMLRRENGHDVSYHLATHEEEANRIKGLSAVDQVAAITELSIHLKTPAAPAAKPAEKPKPQASQAPKPAATVSAKAQSGADTTLDGKTREQRMALIEEAARKRRLAGAHKLG